MQDQVTLDDMAEDIFGLNVRGIRSIGTSWINPGEYFRSALGSNWDGRFTPSIRLWFSLIALASLLQFIWIGSDTPLVSAYADGFRNAGVTLTSGLTFEALGERAALWIYAIAPVFQLLLFLLCLAFIPLWGRKTTYSLRVRFLFIAMIPSGSLMAAFLPAMALVPATHLTALGLILGVATFFLDAITSYRGAFPELRTFARIWRSALLAAIILALNVVANIAAQIAGIVLVTNQYGLSVS